MNKIVLLTLLATILAITGCIQYQVPKTTEKPVPAEKAVGTAKVIAIRNVKF